MGGPMRQLILVDTQWGTSPRVLELCFTVARADKVAHTYIGKHEIGCSWRPSHPPPMREWEPRPTVPGRCTCVWPVVTVAMSSPADPWRCVHIWRRVPAGNIRATQEFLPAPRAPRWLWGRYLYLARTRLPTADPAGSADAYEERTLFATAWGARRFSKAPTNGGMFNTRVPIEPLPAPSDG